VSKDIDHENPVNLLKRILELRGIKTSEFVLGNEITSETNIDLATTKASA